MPSDETVEQLSSQYELIVRRKRGGQPGNKNALRHGFYSRSWKHLERKGIEDVELVSLADEISLLRVCIRRMFENRPTEATLAQDASFVRTVSFAAVALNRLIRTQQKATPIQTDDDLRRALISMMTESVKKPQSAPDPTPDPAPHDS